MPNDQTAKEFEHLVEDAGWYSYCEQVNVGEHATTPEEVIGKLIKL